MLNNLIGIVNEQKPLTLTIPPREREQTPLARVREGGQG